MQPYSCLDDRSVDSAVSVSPTGDPVSVLGISERGRWRGIGLPGDDVRRQAAPEALRLTGGIYVTRRETLRGDRLIGDAAATLVVDHDTAIDIDTDGRPPRGSRGVAAIAMTVRVLVVTGTRADFGLWTPVLAELLQRGSAVDAGLLVMAMHLDPRFGRTIDEVRRSGVPDHRRDSEHTGVGLALRHGGGAGNRPPARRADHRCEPAALAPCARRPGRAARRRIGRAARGHRGRPSPWRRAHAGRGRRRPARPDLEDRAACISSRPREPGNGLPPSGSRQRASGSPARPGLDAIAAVPPRPPEELRARYGLPPDGPYLLLVVHPETDADRAAPTDLAEASWPRPRHPTSRRWPSGRTPTPADGPSPSGWKRRGLT